MALPPAEARRRLAARLCDLAVALSPLLLVPRGHSVAGLLLCAGLSCCGDSLFGPGRSLGKRLFGLRVVLVRDLRPAGVGDSMRRNATLLLGLLPAAFGGPLHATLLATGAVVLAEALVALRPLSRDPGQRRLGDLWAGTQVVDGRVALPLPLPGLLSERPATVPFVSRAAREASSSADAERAVPAPGPARAASPPPTGAACASP